MGKVLVTGATGFTGRALCHRLVADSQQVVAFVRPTSEIDGLRTLGVECRCVDIRHPTEVLDNLAEIGVVYHLAAAYRTELADRAEFRRVNVEATRNLLDGAKRHRIKRFVHCSTVGVQGKIDHPPADEEYRTKPGDHYQQTKLEGELLARQYFKNGLSGVVVRPVGIYGPGDMRFLKLFRPIAKGYFVMIGDGKTLYHMTYIDDLIEGLVLAGRKQEALGQIFTLAGPEYTTIAELVAMIADILGKPHPRLHIPFYPVYVAAVACEKLCGPLRIAPPLYPRRVEFFHLDRAFTINKARQKLGYRPKFRLRDGLKQTADWYRQNRLI